MVSPIRLNIMEKVKSTLTKVIHYEQFMLIVSLVILCIISSFISDVFFTKVNIMNVLRSASLIALTATGMVCILLVGEIDLSVGSVQGFIGVLVVTVLNLSNSFFIAILVSLTVGALIGLVNGLLVTKAKISSFITTLGTMAILRGVAYVSTGGVSLQPKMEDFFAFGAGYLFGIPTPLVVVVIILIIMAFVLNKTVFGRYLYSVGDNASASTLSGINVSKIKIITYIIAGILTSLTAVILSSRLNSGQPNAGIGFEFEVIAAIVLGGVSMEGGKGSLIGAMIGVLILSVLKNILTLANVSSFYQEIARGVVILLAVYLDVRSRKSNQKKILKENV